MGPELASKMPNSKIPMTFEFYMTSSTTFLQERDLTNEEFKSVFFSLVTNKSAGYDGLSFNVVKNNFHSLLKQLKHIFNIPLKTGTFPEKLKIARITSIYKRDDTFQENMCFLVKFAKFLRTAFLITDDTMLSNCRPISALFLFF